MLKGSQAWVCYLPFILNGSVNLAAYLLSLLNLHGWSSVRTGSFTNLSCLLLVKCMLLIIHKHLLSKYVSVPFVIHSNSVRTSLICKAGNMILYLMAIFCVYKLSQTIFMSQQPGMKHSWVVSAELFMLVLPAKDKEIRKRKPGWEEYRPLLHNVNIPGVLY